MISLFNNQINIVPRRWRARKPNQMNQQTISDLDLSSSTLIKKTVTSEIVHKEQKMIINQIIRAFNTSDFNIEKIKNLAKAKKEKISLLYFSSGLSFLLRILISEVVIAGLPFLPRVQLAMMGAIELIYIIMSILSFKSFLGARSVVNTISELGQSFILLAIYGVFATIIYRESNGYGTAILQNYAIFFMIFGVFFEIFFGILKFILIASQKIADCKKQKRGSKEGI